MDWQDADCVPCSAKMLAPVLTGAALCRIGAALGGALVGAFFVIAAGSFRLKDSD
ncbi:hypothetical protein [Alteraurantiacibacter palmitatis]|uniref:hypothetical protein n=1 Tax=Alteraurantiacibacter palmitatis TaxID=2054628 RepID=UPI0030193045